MSSRTAAARLRWTALTLAIGAITAAAAFQALTGWTSVSLAAASLTLSPASGAPGSSVQVGGTGWVAGATVTLTWDKTTQLTTVTVDSSGNLTTTFTVPAAATAGAHTIEGMIAPMGSPPAGAIMSSGRPAGSPPPGGPTTIFSGGSPPPGRPAGTPPAGMASATATFTVVAATPTPSPSATPSATPSPTPSATPSPTPTATPSPTPTPFAVSTLDMAAPCIPEREQAACDDQRARLWRGDLDAWRERQAGAGEPAPTADDAAKLALAFRAEAGDPSAVASVARGLEWPHVHIVGARYRSAEGSEEWIELRNLGGGAQEMTGWSVRVEGSGARWQFEDGVVLEAGQACRLGQASAGVPVCRAQRVGSAAAGDSLPDDGGVISLWVDYLDFKALEVRYSADPRRQPAPPNLQGAPVG